MVGKCSKVRQILRSQADQIPFSFAMDLLDAHRELSVATFKHNAMKGIPPETSWPALERSSPSASPHQCTGQSLNQPQGST